MSQPDRENTAGAVESQGGTPSQADEKATAQTGSASPVNIDAFGEPAQSGRDSGRASDMTRLTEN